MDEHGYPNEHELELVSSYPAKNTNESLRHFMEFIEPMWSKYGSIHEENNVYTLVTGGWSGNEDIIMAMKQNYLLWMFFWQSSTRGGKHVFCKIGQNSEYS